MQFADLPTAILARVLADAEMAPRDAVRLVIAARNRAVCHAVHAHLSPLLVIAAAGGHTRRLHHLLAGGANPDAADASSGMSALQLACRCGVPWSCKLLLDAGAATTGCIELAIRGPAAAAAAAAAAERRPKASRVIVRELLRHGTAPTEDDLVLAIETGDLAIAEMLLSAGAPAGPRALAAAVERRRRPWPVSSAVAAVKMLTRVGGAKPTPDTLARTDPAHADALVPLLCGLGADVDAPTALDASPLHAAARLHDAKALVYALVACGAPIREVDPARPFVLTPVELAAKCANVSVLQALLLAGGRPTRRAEALADGYTSLTFLERRKAAACVQILKTFSQSA